MKNKKLKLFLLILIAAFIAIYFIGNKTSPRHVRADINQQGIKEDLIKEYMSFEIDIEVPNRLKSIKIGVGYATAIVEGIEVKVKCPRLNSISVLNSTGVEYQKGAWYVPSDIAAINNKSNIVNHVTSCSERLISSVYLNNKEKEKNLKTW